MRTRAWMALLALSGACTWGQGEQVTFVAENLELEARVGDGEPVKIPGIVFLEMLTEELEGGVVIHMDGATEDTSVAAELRVDGDLGALCPGSRVVLEGEPGEMRSVSVEGAPRRMRDRLEQLRVSLPSTVRSEGGPDGARVVGESGFPARADRVHGRGGGGW